MSCDETKELCTDVRKNEEYKNHYNIRSNRKSEGKFCICNESNKNFYWMSTRNEPFSKMRFDFVKLDFLDVYRPVMIKKWFNQFQKDLWRDFEELSDKTSKTKRVHLWEILCEQGFHFNATDLFEPIIKMIIKHAKEFQMNLKPQLPKLRMFLLRFLKIKQLTFQLKWKKHILKY